MPDPMILPTIFNDYNNVDAPDTYKLVKLVLLFKVLLAPLIFK